MFDDNTDHFILRHRFDDRDGSLQIKYIISDKLSWEGRERENLPCNLQPTQKCQQSSCDNDDWLDDATFSDIEPFVVRFRIKPWDSGFFTEELRNRQWVRIKRDPELPLLNEKLSINPLELKKFLNKIPDHLLDKTSKYPSKRYQILLFLKKFPNSEFLMESNPGLFLLVIQRIFREVDFINLDNKKLEYSISELMSLKQKRILGWIVGVTAWPSGIKLLKNISQNYYDSADLLSFIKSEIDEKIVRIFRHGKNIHPQQVTKAVKMYHEIESMRCRGDYFGLDIRYAGKIKTFNDLYSAHLFYTRKIECYEDYELIQKRFGKDKFPPSPIKTPKWMIYIDNLKELLEEGEAMHHCVGDQYESAFNGECYYYKILEPERATLSLVFEDQLIAVAEIATAGNQEVSEKTQKLVEDWIIS
jgi:hypothetical protein